MTQKHVFLSNQRIHHISKIPNLLKGKQRRKTFEKYFSRIIAKLDAAAAQSSELPSRKQLSLALDALLYDQRQRREPGFWPLIWENSLKNGSLRVYIIISESFSNFGDRS